MRGPASAPGAGRVVSRGGTGTETGAAAPAPPLTGLALLLDPAGSGGKDQELLLTGAGLTTRIRARFTSATWD